MKEENPFSWQALYELFHEIARLAPWQILGEDKVFAVEHERYDLAFVHMDVTEDGKALLVAPDEEAHREFAVWYFAPPKDGAERLALQPYVNMRLLRLEFSMNPAIRPPERKWLRKQNIFRRTRHGYPVLYNSAPGLCLGVVRDEAAGRHAMEMFSSILKVFRAAAEAGQAPWPDIESLMIENECEDNKDAIPAALKTGDPNVFDWNCYVVDNYFERPQPVHFAAATRLKRLPPRTGEEGRLCVSLMWMEDPAVDDADKSGRLFFPLVLLGLADHDDEDAPLRSVMLDPTERVGMCDQLQAKLVDLCENFGWRPHTVFVYPASVYFTILPLLEAADIGSECDEAALPNELIDSFPGEKYQSPDDYLRDRRESRFQARY